MIAPIVTVALATAITFGNTRLRIPADVAILTVAAVGIDALLARRRPSRLSP